MADGLPTLLVQLDPEAPPGLIPEVAAERGVSLEVIDAADVAPSDLATAPGLIVLGSTAAAIDLAGPIAQAVAERLTDDRPTLGLDAGAYFMAAALDGTIRPGQSHEFGYVDLSPTELTAADPVLQALGGGLPVMEWHEDAIDLPDDVPILARCGRGRIQAFRKGESCYGLRFHPGATADIVKRWAALRGIASNNPAIRVRNGAEIIRHQARAEQFGRAVIEKWLALVRALPAD